MSTESEKLKLDDGREIDLVALSGGKRTNIGPAETQPWNWWVGWGKDEGCQFEGPWEHMAILAAKILRHPNTEKLTRNLYRPDLVLTPEQEDSY